jgi:hypothetical protein
MSVITPRPYDDFLASKQPARRSYGLDVHPDEMSESLFPFQRDLTAWAVRTGRAALFADTGLGKTRMQLEWARLVGGTVLIVAPLAVAHQTVEEARRIGIDAAYAADQSAVGSSGIYVTNYERVDRFESETLSGVVLDESSILKAVDSKTRRQLTGQFACVPLRLACSATPAPNDVAELANHAEFLGQASRAEMLAAYFVHDDDGWRLKGHAAEALYEWLSTWAAAVKRPSDLGYPDAGYRLPPLRISAEVVPVDFKPEGQLFATDLGGVGGRAAVRRQTLAARTDRATKLASQPGQWVVWCGLNAEADAVAEGVDGVVNVPGAWSAEAKAEALVAFSRGDHRALVTKPSIAGYGLNLQNVSQMCFVGLSDSYESYYQAIRRCWRYGQENPVDVRIVVSDLENEIVDNVRAKEAAAAETTNRLAAYAREAVRW